MEISMSNIKNIYETELKCLKDGIGDGKNPYHTFTLSSLNGEYPEVRTIVLRGVDVEPLKIYFNADHRSPKVKELKNHPSCSALFYDQKRKVQLRFKCHAALHYDNDISKETWSNTPLQSRKCYMGPFSPSKPLDEWHPNIPLEYLKTDPDKEHSKKGYVNFTHVELSIVESDVLQLHHDGHVRFKVKNGNDFFHVAP